MLIFNEVNVSMKIHRNSRDDTLVGYARLQSCGCGSLWAGLYANRISRVTYCNGSRLCSGFNLVHFIFSGIDMYMR